MEAEWSADRANLRLALRDHPEWSVPQLARQIGRSISWVKKWRQRLREAPPDDETVLQSRSRARKHPPPSLSPLAIERILAIRDEPPANL
jgi:Homeodomain-like domain